ncbi:hypothetical protein F443_00394 [Phytophthora nicotianae P1569]|uniref:Uncharacterized protein n=2 Tax=Phytophthora nicotianae TaxID=4792 RepID=V9G0R7_PHYNI|nr:hypothetical protein F443_00394 [Phytophthora nicotianae P1569]
MSEVAYRVSSFEVIRWIYRKFEDKNRVDLVGQVGWFIPTGRLQPDDQYWTVIEPSPEDPEHFWIVRTHHPLEGRSTCSAMGSTLQQKAIQESMMEVIAKNRAGTCNLCKVLFWIKRAP